MSIDARRSHAGDEYQLRIATHWLVQLLRDDSIESVLVEAVNLPGQASLVEIDDVVITHKDGTSLFAQAKKNQSDHQRWSISDLSDELVAARDQLEQCAGSRVIFYSRTPFGALGKLVQEVPAHLTFDSFLANAPATLSGPLSTLASVMGRSEEQTYGLVLRIQIGSAAEFDDWDQLNEALLKSLTTNATRSVELLERLIRRRQSGISGAQTPIRRDEVIHTLEKTGVYLAGGLDLRLVREEFARASAIGRSWSRTIRGVTIPRSDVDELIALVREQRQGSVLLTDGPGTGKTCVLLSFVEAVEKEPGWDLLFIRGDEFAQCSNDRDLVDRGLPEAFVAKCAALAQERRVVVVIDSLDVLSLHGEHQSLRALLSVVDRLLHQTGVTCVVACRAFDLAYDPLLRDRKWDRRVCLKPLSLEHDVIPVLKGVGIATDPIDGELAKLLVVPQNLRLFADMAAANPNSASWRTIGSDVYALHAHFLDTVVRCDPTLGDEALRALEAIATRMAEQRTLYVPRTTLNLAERTLQRLISQGLLLEAGGQTLRLGHQTLLDGLVVRHAIDASKTLLEFIRVHPPFPFIRPAVQAFARHVRSYGHQVFGRQVREVFEASDAPYHLKRAIIETIAEIEPGPDDWPLVRYLYGAHRDFFHRLLGGIRGAGWFHILSQLWWPTLSASSDSDTSRVRFTAVLDRWMNDYPDEILAFWRDALESTWGNAGNVAWSIQIQLKDFQHWSADGVEDLLRDLLARSGDKDFLGAPIGKFVESTGRGLDLLWQFITKDVDNNHGSRMALRRALRCQDHHFHRKGFLGDLLAGSDAFLEVALRGVEGWSDAKEGVDFGSLHDTAWEDHHTEFDLRHASDLRVLMDAIDEALRRRAATRAPSWGRFETALRATRNLGLRYLLIQACLDDVEGNADCIATQLLDEELIKHGQLDYELGLLANKAYPILPPTVAEAHQEILLRHHAVYAQRHGDDDIAAHSTYELLQPIPALFRTPATQAFLDRWEWRFGIGPRRPHVVACGGTVGAPISIEQLSRLAPPDVRRLLAHYENSSERFEWSTSGLVGGRDELCRVVEAAASRMPIEYLANARQWWMEGLRDEYVKAAIHGVSDHLKYRFGNLAAPNGWSVGESPPDGERVVDEILSAVERYHSLWGDEWAMARILEGCADAVTTLGNAERITWPLIRLTRAKDPEVERVRFDPDKRQDPEAHDLLQDSMNAARGIAADAAMTLASRLTEQRLPLPDLLVPTLKAFASDPVASVRASVLRSLPYFLQEHPEVGWDLFARAMAQPNPHLWEIAERALYCRIGRDWQRVSPYLSRMLEHPNIAGKTWGRLTTLACLHGKIDEHAVFDELEGCNAEALWLGAAEVFASNLDKPEIAASCRSGLVRLLRRRPVPGTIIDLVDRHLAKDSVLDGAEIVAAVLDAYGESTSRVDLFGVFEWIAGVANRDPVGTLPLLEKLVSGLEARLGETHYLHSEPLIAALLVVLREADQFGDAALVSRALSLQDAYLRLNVRGIEDVLNAAAARD